MNHSGQPKIRHQIRCATGLFQWRTRGAETSAPLKKAPIGKTCGALSAPQDFPTGALVAHWRFHSRLMTSPMPIGLDSLGMWYYITVSPEGTVGKMPDPFPKINMLKGSLHLEPKSCGKPNCRCQRGFRHGPYVVRRWRENGRQRKQYVRQENVAEMLSAIARRQALDQEVVEIRKQLRRSVRG